MTNRSEALQALDNAEEEIDCKGEDGEFCPCCRAYLELQKVRAFIEGRPDDPANTLPPLW